MRPVVTVYGKPGCHLCQEASRSAAEICAEFGAELVEVSILDDPELVDRYAEQIPVIHVNGQMHDYFRVNPARLRSALEAVQ